MSHTAKLPIGVPDSLALRSGGYYSNGGYGRSWGVREILSIEGLQEPVTVHFRGIAGACRRKIGHCSRQDFLAWARYEVALNENSWQRVGYFSADDLD